MCRSERGPNDRNGDADGQRLTAIGSWQHPKYWARRLLQGARLRSSSNKDNHRGEVEVEEVMRDRDVIGIGTTL